MNIRVRRVSFIRNQGACETRGNRLDGKEILATRMMCVALTLLCLTIFSSSLPVYLKRIQIVCTRSVCSHWQLTPSDVQALESIHLSVNTYALLNVTLGTVSVLVWFTVALFIAWRKSREWMPLLITMFLVTLAVEQVSHLTQPLAESVAAWQGVISLANVLAIALAILTISLFPTGCFVPGWTRWLMVMFTLMTIWITVYSPAFLLEPDRFLNNMPFMLPFVLLLLTGLVGAQIYRYRHVSSPIQRQQTRWVVFGFMVGPTANVGFVMVALFITPSQHINSLYFLLGKPMYTLLMLLAPISFGLAIFRDRLWEIDLILHRTLVYSILTASTISVYMLVVVLLDRLFRTQDNLAISLLGTGVSIALFQPLRTRLQQSINRLIFGERDNPYVVLSRLGRRLETILAPDEMLPTIVETIARSLKLPYAAISLIQGDTSTIVAAYGESKDAVFRVPLMYQAQPIGELLVAPRSPGEGFHSADRRLLEDLGTQTSVAAYAVSMTINLKRLATDLQSVRTRLVTAREEERRRLRRDLHDGLGSVLASLNWRAGAIRSLLSRDPTAADTLVVEQQQTIQAAIADIRRLVYDLRPSALDELGLVGAIRERAAQQSRPVERDGASGLRIEVVAPASLPAFPAAVEVAAYRIIQEALANVIRHAHAHQCNICLACTKEFFRVEITDDGVGLPAEYHAGVGLLSMHERAEELGGTCEILPAHDEGTCVRACLPLARD